MKVTLTIRIHDRTGEKLWVVRPVKDIGRDRWKSLKSYVYKCGGYYSRFLNAFYFKEDPLQCLVDRKLEIDDLTGDPDAEARGGSSGSAETKKDKSMPKKNDPSKPQASGYQGELSYRNSDIGGNPDVVNLALKHKDWEYLSDQIKEGNYSLENLASHINRNVREGIIPSLTSSDYDDLMKKVRKSMGVTASDEDPLTEQDRAIQEIENKWVTQGNTWVKNRMHYAIEGDALQIASDIYSELYTFEQIRDYLYEIADDRRTISFDRQWVDVFLKEVEKALMDVSEGKPASEDTGAGNSDDDSYWTNPDVIYMASGEHSSKQFHTRYKGRGVGGTYLYEIIGPENKGAVLNFKRDWLEENITVWKENPVDVLRGLIPSAQLAVDSADLQVNRDRLVDIIGRIPEIYSTEDQPMGEKVAWLHYFGGSVDVYVLEFKPPNDLYTYGSFLADGEFEGGYWYVDNGDVRNLPPIINLDYYWEPKQLKEIDDIRNPYFERPPDSGQENIKKTQDITGGIYKNQYEVNKAIERLIDADFPVIYTPDVIEFIQRYSGYGGLGDYMDKEKDADLIKGTLFEYFTPEPILRKMWGLAYKYGFTEEGSVLEPSCGTGRFIKFAPDQSQVTAYEINRYSAAIADASYARAQVIEKPFESEFYSGYGDRTRIKDYQGRYDLVIGNFPFGEYQGKYAGMGEKKYSGATQIDHHFIVRGLDALKPGGLLVAIVSSRLLQGGHEKIKAEMQKRGEFIDAYRLPTGIFQNTRVTADIVVFRKKG